ATASQVCTVKTGTEYEVSVWFNVIERTGTESTDGASLAVLDMNGNVIASTSAFTATDKGFRKALITLPKSNQERYVNLTLNLKGAGTVYFDDVELKERTDLILNGDFEASCGEGMPGGINYVVDGNLTTDMSETGGITMVAPTGYADGNYMQIARTNGSIVFEIPKNKLSVGKRYKLTFDYKGTASEGVSIKHTRGNGETAFGSLPAAADWEDNFTYYFTCSYVENNEPFKIYIGTNGDSADVRCIDNVALNEVTEELAAKPTFKRLGSSFTASYTGFAFDYTVENTETIGSEAVIEKVGEPLNLYVAVYELDNENNLILQTVERLQQRASAIVYPENGKLIKDCPINEIPTTIEKKMTFAGEPNKQYVAKAFVWSGANGLMPCTAAPAVELYQDDGSGDNFADFDEL
ncbi:MAG: hypothetical protein IJE41_00875, partial [Clostridia bacterium]|nr:hypothetical protein [Clostridia bacterium]